MGCNQTSTLTACLRSEMLSNKAAEHTETQCGSCEDGKAKGYCRDCSEFVCDECQAVHRKLKKMKHHKIATLNESQTQTANLSPPKKVIPNCPKHPENALKIYCETCSALTCNDCAILFHRDHNYDLLANILLNTRKSLSPASN